MSMETIQELRLSYIINKHRIQFILSVTCTADAFQQRTVIYLSQSL